MTNEITRSGVAVKKSVKKAAKKTVKKDAKKVARKIAKKAVKHVAKKSATPSHKRVVSKKVLAVRVFCWSRLFIIWSVPVPWFHCWRHTQVAIYEPCCVRVQRSIV